MSWFRNLNATPRLMCSFGVLLALTLGITCLATNSLGRANDRVQTLYQKEMQGVLLMDSISSARQDLAMKDRDAMIKVDDTVARKADIAAVKADYAKMYVDLAAAEQVFDTDEEKRVIAEMRETLPPYEKDVAAFTDAIEAHDLSGARAKVYLLAPAAAKMASQIDRALKLKQNLAEQSFRANNEAYRGTRGLLIVSYSISLGLGVLLSITIARSFSKPLEQAVRALEKVADGDLTASLDVDTKDEMGRMAMALNSAVERLNGTIREVAESAANANSSSQQLAAASEAIASGAQEQAASLEETSASLEQISSAVRLSADNAAKASELASGASSSADHGKEGSNAVAAMAEISNASAKISEIISTVDEIAFQTNLLAVNAAVEAARAGEEGRGFAVVASEVRSLAQRSSVAAKEIKTLIQDSLRKVDRGSELVNRVTQLVSEIAHTSKEQSAGIDQVNTAMTQMDLVTQSNSAQTEELSATAESLSDQAADLLGLVNNFVLSKDQAKTRERRALLPQQERGSGSVPQPIKSLPKDITSRQSGGRVAAGGAAKSSAVRRGKRPTSSHLPASTAVVPVPEELEPSETSFESF